MVNKANVIKQIVVEHDKIHNDNFLGKYTLNLITANEKELMIDSDEDLKQTIYCIMLNLRDLDVEIVLKSATNIELNVGNVRDLRLDHLEKWEDFMIENGYYKEVKLFN